MPIMPVEDINISNENNQALITPSQSYLSFLLALLIFTQGILSSPLPIGFILGTVSTLLHGNSFCSLVSTFS